MEVYSDMPHIIQYFPYEVHVAKDTHIDIYIYIMYKYLTSILPIHICTLFVYLEHIW